MRRWAKTGWAWVGVLLGVGLVELILVRTHQPTLSQFVQHWARRSGWVTLAIVALMTLFTLHLVWPGPVPDPPPAPTYVACWEDC